ncbi:hypothetical protein EH233_13560 [Anabaena sp. YBS01]|nr:hypothetical protein EH233_13560 [Anabaena sp. YBS01]
MVSSEKCRKKKGGGGAGREVAKRVSLRANFPTGCYANGDRERNFYSPFRTHHFLILSSSQNVKKFEYESLLDS